MPSASEENSECELVDRFTISTGDEVMKLSSVELFCEDCKQSIDKEDSVKVFPRSICHLDCSVAAARKTPPVDPTSPRKRKADAKANRQVGRVCTETFGGDEQKANEKRDMLMKLSKTKQSTGEFGGEMWRMRYEPIMRKSWLRTRRQVAFRWIGAGKSKTVPFDFDEEHSTDETFLSALEQVMLKLLVQVGVQS